MSEQPGLIDVTVRVRVKDLTSWLKLTKEEQADALGLPRKSMIVSSDEFNVSLNKEYGKEGATVIWHIHQSTHSYACEKCIEIAQDEEN